MDRRGKDDEARPEINNPLRFAIRLIATIKNRSQEASPSKWRNGRRDGLHAEALHGSRETPLSPGHDSAAF